MKYRLKQILSDGRAVYASKRNKISLIEEEQIERFNNMSKGVYTPDLCWFGSEEGLGKKVIHVVDYIWEKENSELDYNAFIIGAIKVDKNCLE